KEATEEECNTLEVWLCSNKENREEFEKIKSAFELTEYKISDPQWEKSSLKSEILYKIIETQTEELEERRPIWSRIIQFSSYAALILVLIGIPLYYLNIRSINGGNGNLTEVMAPMGSKTRLTLDDGTKVWLNAGSVLKYNRNYNKSNRDLYLEGEAFFDVTKNKSLPMLVNAGDIRLKVLGTAFNVKAYKEEGTIETTLVRGSVEVRQMSKEGNGVITLKPNQRAIFIKHEGRLLLSEAEKIAPVANQGANELTNTTLRMEQIVVNPKAEVEESISWKDGYIRVNQETLESLSMILARRYDVEIQFLDQRSKNYFYTGKIKEASLEQVMEALKCASPIDYEIKQNHVYIKENRQRIKEFK
ncbi:MAG: FecR family protein, partial [Bacteroidetes bacterium]|nr:FecR family protein [Bacteroidota bacterium]